MEKGLRTINVHLVRAFGYMHTVTKVVFGQNSCYSGARPQTVAT